MILYLSALMLLSTAVVGQTSTTKCPIDLMLLLDGTEKMEPYLRDKADQRYDFMEKIAQKLIDTNLGLGVFYDRPRDQSNKCYELTLGLGAELIDLYDRLRAMQYGFHGGENGKQDHYQAIIDAATEYKTSWRPLAPVGQVPKEGEAAARFILLITNSDANAAGTLPDRPPNSGGAINNLEDCFFNDYPSLDQVKAVMTEMNIKILFSIPEPSNVQNWAAINEELGQPREYYSYESQDSEKYGMHRGLQHWYDTVCADLMQPAVQVQMGEVPRNLDLNIDAKGQAQ